MARDKIAEALAKRQGKKKAEEYEQTIEDEALDAMENTLEIIDDLAEGKTPGEALENSFTKIMLKKVQRIEIECIIDGAKQKIVFGGGIAPDWPKKYIQAIDPDAQFQDKFFTKGGGNKEIKTTYAFMITCTVYENGEGYELTCEDAPVIDPETKKKKKENRSVKVSREKAATFLGTLENIGVAEEYIERLKEGIEQKKKTTMVLLQPGERFTVKYSSFNDQCYLQSLEPAPKEAEEDDDDE